MEVTQSPRFTEFAQGALALAQDATIVDETAVTVKASSLDVVDSGAVGSSVGTSFGTAFASMTREQLVEWILAAALVVVGLSLLLRSRAWINAFSTAAAHPFAPFLTGLYALLSGLFIVTLHNVWVTDARVVVTLIGWFALAGGVLFLLIPETYRWLLRRVPMTPQLVALRGLVRIALGGTIVGYLLSHG
ncbi:MAG: hypothetical protein RIR10_1196 [Planctomycetota bacterium]